jgi:hypothetical protein
MNARAVTINTSPAFQAGWINMNFTGTNALLGIISASGAHLFSASSATPAPVSVASAHTFTGLPVTGFMVNSRANAAVACTLPGGGTGNCSGNYMTLFNHSYRTTITP